MGDFIAMMVREYPKVAFAVLAAWSFMVGMLAAEVMA